MAACHGFVPLSFFPTIAGAFSFPSIAELSVGFISAAATVGAAQLTMGAGFTGRHERTHREETMGTKRNTKEFLVILSGRDAAQAEEFIEVRARCLNEYYAAWYSTLQGCFSVQSPEEGEGESWCKEGKTGHSRNQSPP